MNMEPEIFMTRALAATRDTKLGAILRAAFGLPDQPFPAFQGKAIITSDGFVMCDYTAPNGEVHHGAFVCDVDDLESNLAGLSKHLHFSEDDQNALMRKVEDWIGIDYRPQAGLRRTANRRST